MAKVTTWVTVINVSCRVCHAWVEGSGPWCSLYAGHGKCAGRDLEQLLRHTIRFLDRDLDQDEPSQT